MRELYLALLPGHSATFWTVDGHDWGQSSVDRLFLFVAEGWSQVSAPLHYELFHP